MNQTYNRVDHFEMYGWPSQMDGMGDLSDVLNSALSNAGKALQNTVLTDVASSSAVQSAVATQANQAAASSLSNWLIQNETTVMIAGAAIVGLVIFLAVRK